MIKGRSFLNLTQRLRYSSGETEVSAKKNPKILRKIVLGSVIGSYGYYQWEHYNRNMELAKKLDIPFYKVN